MKSKFMNFHPFRMLSCLYIDRNAQRSLYLSKQCLSFAWRAFLFYYSCHAEWQHLNFLTVRILATAIFTYSLKEQPSSPRIIIVRTFIRWKHEWQWIWVALGDNSHSQVDHMFSNTYYTNSSLVIHQRPAWAKPQLMRGLSKLATGK